MEPPKPKTFEETSSLAWSEQRSPAKFKSKCQEVLKGLMTHDHGWVFNIPIDPIELGLPNYFQIIKRPMDLGIIKKRLEAEEFYSLDDFKNDVKLTFNNAMTYNEAGSVIHDMAKDLMAKFDKDYARILGRPIGEDVTTNLPKRLNDNNVHCRENDETSFPHFDSVPLWLPDREQRDERRNFDLDEDYRQKLEQEMIQEAKCQEQGQGMHSSHSRSEETLSHAIPAQLNNHASAACEQDFPDGIPQWMKEENDAVLALAVQNYVKFYGLSEGSINLQDPSIAKLLEKTSAGVAGWARACVLSAPLPKQTKYAGSGSGDDEREHQESKAPSESCMLAFARSDEEESRQLRFAMLESIGVRPGCNKRNNKRTREDTSTACCYYSDDKDSASDFTSNNDEGEDNGNTLTKKPKSSAEVKDSATKEPGDDMPNVSSQRRSIEDRAEVQHGDSPLSDEDFVVVQVPPDETPSRNTEPKCYEQAARKKHQSAHKVETTTHRAQRQAPTDQSPPKVSRSSWQWQNFVGHLRATSATSSCKSPTKSKEVENCKDQKPDDVSDGEWSIVEAEE